MLHRSCRAPRAAASRRPVRAVRRGRLESAAHAGRPGRELPRLAPPGHHRAHRSVDRRGRVVGVVPEPGRCPQRRRDGPGPFGPPSRPGHARRLPQRRGRRGRPERGPAGAAGRDRRRRDHLDGGRVDDQGDDGAGHRRRRTPRRDPDGRGRLHLSSPASGLSSPAPPRCTSSSLTPLGTPSSVPQPCAALLGKRRWATTS